MDVVEPGDQDAWADGPFSGTIREGKVWGRGSCDAKAALAAQVYAARAIADSGITLGGTLLLVGSVDDEGGYDLLNWPGMTFLAEVGLTSHGFPQPEMVVNGEASGLDRICGSFMGRLVLEITVRGETAHASTSHGTNAIDHALLLVDRLKRLQLEEHPVQGRETLSICFIAGGAARYSDVPDECRVGIDVRAVPPYGTAAVREKIGGVVDELEAEFPSFRSGGIRYLSEREPVEIPEDHRLVAALESAARHVGVSARYAPILGTGDLEAFLRRGAVGVTYGPGSISRVHRPDEYVEIEALVDQTKIYALAAVELCRGSA
jgi:succinyl-diaminopimelate desuccinylase